MKSNAGRRVPQEAMSCWIPQPHPWRQLIPELLPPWLPADGQCWACVGTSPQQQGRGIQTHKALMGKGSLEFYMSNSGWVCGCSSYLKLALLYMTFNHRIPEYQKHMRSHILGPQAATEDRASIPQGQADWHHLQTGSHPSRHSSVVSPPWHKVFSRNRSWFCHPFLLLKTRQSSAPTFPFPERPGPPSPHQQQAGLHFRPAGSSPQAQDLDVAGLVQQALVGRGAWGLRCQLLAVTECSPLSGGMVTRAGKSQGTGCWQNWLFFRFFSRYCIRRSSQKASGTRCPVWYFQTQLPLGLLTLMLSLYSASLLTPLWV